MFAQAYEIASPFTFPLVVSFRYFDGTVDASVGAYIVLNREGWVLTAAHVVQALLHRDEHQRQVQLYNESVLKISQDASLNKRQQEQRISVLKSNPKWVLNLSTWFGVDHWRVGTFQVNPQLDLAVGRLDSFDPGAIKTYPVLKNPKTLRPGTSLCKLGFPFYEIKPSFEESDSTFRFPAGSLPIPRFPMDGIFTRVISIADQGSPAAERFIETSSPGLRGQSGGPVFDANGTVWGVQSRTYHLPLGFSPTLKVNSREVLEHQFLNVGWAVHPRIVADFLRENGVKFKMSED